MSRHNVRRDDDTDLTAEQAAELLLAMCGRPDENQTVKRALRMGTDVLRGVLDPPDPGTPARPRTAVRPVTGTGRKHQPAAEPDRKEHNPMPS